MLEPTPFLAHPLTEPAVLPIPPLVLAVAAVVLVVLAGLVGRARGTAAESAPAPLPSPPGRLSPLAWVGRLAGIAVVTLVVVAGTTGRQDQLRNVAPALVVGVGWPALVAVAAIGFDVWRALNPLDGLGRALEPFGAPPGDAPADVWPAVVAGAGWTGYLALHPDPLAPRTLATVVGGYVVVGMLGALAFGRVTWLGRWDALGLLTGWLATHRPGRHTYPAGAEVLIAVVYAGTLLPALVRSDLFGMLELVSAGWLLRAAVGVAVAAVIAAGLLVARRALAPAGHLIVAAVLPGLAALVVAMALTAGRLTTSLQLLPRVLADPFGEASVPRPIYPFVLTATTIAVVQVVVLAVGHVTGSVLLRRRVPADATDARRRAVTLLGVLAAASVLAVTSPFD